MTRWAFVGETFAGCLVVGRALWRMVAGSMDRAIRIQFVCVVAQPGRTAWRDLLESEILSGKTPLSLAENKNGKVPARAVAGHNHGGPRSVLKAFCSGTVHLQFIESFFQREAADRASHGFQCESSTQTNLCRLRCQLLSQEKKPAWGQAVKCREHNSFWQGNPLACTKGSQRENWDPPIQQLWN